MGKKLISKGEDAFCNVNDDALFDEEVIQIGAGRSGTTVVWQILNYIYSRAWKTHSPKSDILEDSNKKVFFTYRDTRDLVISFGRVTLFGKPKTPKSMRKGQIIHSEPTESVRVEFEKEIKSSFPQLDYAIFLAYRTVLDGVMYKSGRRRMTFGPFSPVQKNIHELLKSRFKNVLEIKYEDYLGEEEKLDKLVDDICEFSNIEISPAKKEFICNKFSRKSNLLIQEGYKDFKAGDELSGIHGNHIKLDPKATWRTILSTEQIKHVDSIFEEELAHFGYAKKNNETSSLHKITKTP